MTYFWILFNIHLNMIVLKKFRDFKFFFERRSKKI